MGFESFQVELRGGPATFANAEQVVREFRYSHPDYESIELAGSKYFTIEDGSHVIEVEVAAKPVKVSCRFTLCHPPTVDTAFLDIVCKLQIHLKMDAIFGERRFPIARFTEFANLATDCITERRAEWVANFGPTTLPAKTSEASEKMVLRNCVPDVAGKPQLVG